MFIAGAYFFVYAAQFLSCSLRQKHPLLDVNPVGSTFNIQNSIPNKSQKTKAVSETNNKAKTAIKRRKKQKKIYSKVWDQETVRSSRTTRTKSPLKSLISEGFSYSLSIAAQNSR